MLGDTSIWHLDELLAGKLYEGGSRDFAAKITIFKLSSHKRRRHERNGKKIKDNKETIIPLLSAKFLEILRLSFCYLVAIEKVK